MGVRAGNPPDDTGFAPVTRAGAGTGPGAEIARIAAEKGLLRDPALAARFLEIAGFRNRLTHFYEQGMVSELHGILERDLPDLDGLARELEDAAARMSRG